MEHLRLRNPPSDASLVCLRTASRRGRGAENSTLPLRAGADHFGERKWAERFQRGASGDRRTRCHSAQRPFCGRQCPRRSARLFGEKSDDCAIIDSPSNTGLSLLNSVCEVVTTQNALVSNKHEGSSQWRQWRRYDACVRWVRCAANRPRTTA